MTDDAEELARLTLEANILIARTQEAYQAWVAADAIMRAMIERRNEVERRVRYEAATAGARSTEGPAGPGPRPGPAAPSAPRPGPAAPSAPTAPETSTRTVQNVLFILGGLLLGTAAIVFTAVAWATFGVSGRATILGVVTLIALALPLVALWRGLRATAETFAAVGLLLVVLDGYAAWAVDLFGVRSLPGTRYAGLVFAVTAAVGLGYRAATRLTGPAVAAVLVAQPVLPLLIADSHPSRAGWAAAAVAVAAADLLIVLRNSAGDRAGADPRAAALRIIGWFLYGVALLAGFTQALGAEVAASTDEQAAWAGVVVVLSALALAAGAALTRSGSFHATAAGATVLATVLGAGRFVSVAWPDDAAVLTAAVIAAVAVLVAASTPVLPATMRTGGTIGALIATGGLGLAVAGATLYAAVATIARALPLWSASLAADEPFTWQLPAAIGLAALAFAVSLRGAARVDALVAGAVLAVLAVPASFDLAWWSPSVVDILGAAVLAALAESFRSTPRRWTGPALGAGVLAAHAVPASLSRPELTAAVLGALVVVGLVLALPRRGILAAPGLVVALMALPPAVGSTLVWSDVPAWWVARLTAGSVALVLLALVAVRVVRPNLTWYAFGAAAASAVIWPVVAALSSAEPGGIYAAASLLAVALAVLAMPHAPGGAASSFGALAAIPGAVLLAVAVLPAVLAVVALPYGWTTAIWDGAPNGIGLAPAGLGSGLRATEADAVALAVLALASAAAVYALTRRLRSAIGGLSIGGPTAILVWLAAVEAAWPTIPAVTLLMGLTIIVLAAVLPIGAVRTTVVTLQGLVYIGAGLAGSLTVEWATIAAFGSTVVAASVVGAAGRSTAWRVNGWLVAVGAALVTAASAGFAADLTARDAAFGVLGAAVAALALGAALAARRPAEPVAARPPAEPVAARPPAEPVAARPPAESVAVGAAAHSGAIVALLFTVGWATHAAAVCTIWGVAVGLRALWPGTGRAGRARLAAVAAGFELLAWWLLIADRGVALVEAYTLPLAAVALLAGFAALRARPELTSWTAYGPALAAALLPSLATILGTTGDPIRRLALGAGALAVVVAGSVRRRRAPVVMGGVVLVIVALHEIAVAWQLLPGWVPLGLGGVILVLLAITYERRLRDVRRLREMLARMT